MLSRVFDGCLADRAPDSKMRGWMSATINRVGGYNRRQGCGWAAVCPPRGASVAAADRARGVCDDWRRGHRQACSDRSSCEQPARRGQVGSGQVGSGQVRSGQGRAVNQRRGPRRILCTALDEYCLTPAERAVAGGVARGESNALIAHIRGVTCNTVRTQVGAIFKAADVAGRAEFLADVIERVLAIAERERASADSNR